MDMIELKYKQKDKKESAINPYPMDEYPVSMWLGNDQLEQLGIKSLDVGQEMEIVAKVKVSSFSMNQSTEGSYRDARLSVMAMGMMPKKEEKSAASVLYGAKDEQ